MAPRKGGAIFIPMYVKRASQPAARLRQHQQNMGAASIALSVTAYRREAGV